MSLENIFDLTEDKVVAMHIMKKLHPKGTKRLKEVFVMYARFNARGPRATEKNGPGLTNAKFAKLCRECGIVQGKHVTINDVDVAFTVVKEKGRSTINFNQFKHALKFLAQHVVDDDAYAHAPPPPQLAPGKFPTGDALAVAGMTRRRMWRGLTRCSWCDFWTHFYRSFTHIVLLDFTADFALAFCLILLDFGAEFSRTMTA